MAGETGESPTEQETDREIEVGHEAGPPTRPVKPVRFDANVHSSRDLHVASCGEPSTLCILDITPQSVPPFFIPEPVEIEGTVIRDFLDKTGIELPERLRGTLSGSKVSLSAFYYDPRGPQGDQAAQETGPLLMIFEIELGKGLMADLMGPEASAIFEVHGASLRLLRIPTKDDLATLKTYWAQLSG
jgi:hypothetical protein